MRTEGNPLDLNNFPEDYSKQAIEDTSSSAGHRKKRSGGKDGKDESGKVYECRFCSLKFCKSQALGGHMNRHRQERETETLNRARQLVFSTDNLAAQAAHHHHLAGAQPIPHGVFHQAANIGRPIYPPPRLFSGSSVLLAPLPPPPPPPHQPFLYPSPPRHISYTSQYPPPNDYYIGHVLPGNSQYTSAPPTTDTNYTCIGAPVGHAFPGTSSGGAEQDMGAPGHGRVNAFQEGF